MCKLKQQFVRNEFGAWFSVILKMIENSERFDIWATCYLITAGPYAKRIMKIATLVADELAKKQFSQSAIFARICRDVTQITMSRRVKCTGLLC